MSIEKRCQGFMEQTGFYGLSLQAVCGGNPICRACPSKEDCPVNQTLQLLIEVQDNVRQHLTNVVTAKEIYALADSLRLEINPENIAMGGLAAALRSELSLQAEVDKANLIIYQADAVCDDIEFDVEFSKMTAEDSLATCPAAYDYVAKYKQHMA